GRLTAVGSQSTNIDAHDNLQGLAGDSVSFTFDDFSGVLLSSTTTMGTTTYSYDAADRRVLERHPNGTTTVFLWDRAQMVAHGDPADLTIDVPGSDPDQHIASVENNGTGTKWFYHQGPDQSVLAVTDGSGLAEGYSYSAFGDVTVFGPGGNVISASM